MAQELSELARELTGLLFSAKRSSDIIAVADLRDIWTHERINALTSNQLTDNEVRNVQDHRLRTLSLLLYVVEDPEAAVFARYLIQHTTITDQRLHAVQDHELTWLQNTRYIRHFIDMRKIFTAIVLTEGNEETLEPGQVLPLVKMVKKLGEGMNGVVEAHIVARGHLLLKKVDMKSEKVRVAKKTFADKDSQIAKQELKIIRSLREALLKTRGEIRLCIPVSIITEGVSVHALSLCAGWDLEKRLNTLNSDHRNRDNAANIMASINQIKGLVGALEFLHNQQPAGDKTCYCHMDLKPENILVFESPDPSHILGQWRITDFGISTVSCKRGKLTEGGPRGGDGKQHITFTVGTSAKQVKGKYQPPEINQGQQNNMGRGSDIWSLGCVFAEVLAANFGTLTKLRGQMHTSHSRSPPSSFARSVLYRHVNAAQESYFYRETSFAVGPVVVRKYALNISFDKWLRDYLGGMKSAKAPRQSESIIRDMMAIDRIKRIKSGQLLERLRHIK